VFAVIAAFCVGRNTSGRTAIYTAVANSCYVVYGGGTITAEHKYNMP